MHPLRRVVPATALSGVLLIGGAFAQQPERDQPNPPRRANPGQADQPRQPAQPGQPGQPGQPAGRQPGRAAQGDAVGDGQFAACLIIDNHKEIALAQFAHEKSQNDQVKAFAEKMSRDHQQFIQQLQETATSGGFSNEQLTLRGAQSPADARPGQADPQRPGTAPRTQDPQAPRRTARPAELEGRGGQGVSFIELKQELTEQCLQSIREELEQKPEAEFDKCYIGSQVMAHMAMVDTLEVFSRHASPELQSVLEKGKQTAQMHLKEAKTLAQQLEKGAEGGQRERANP
jgi:predicted outer membrane protein